MKQTNKILKGLMLSTLVLFLGFSASADIILRLGTGVDQGTTHRDVYVDCNDKGDPVTATVMCLAEGTKTCPTNAIIRAGCPGAIVHPWIPNVGVNGLDNTVSSIVSQFALGMLSGNIIRVYQNIQTLETVSVSFNWHVDPLDSEIVIITISEM